MRIKLVVEVELNNDEFVYLMEHSVERIFNNAIYIGELGEVQLRSEVARERASTLWQDVEEVKPLLVRLWAKLMNEAHKIQLSERENS
jgi:hypothetical protein